MSEFMKVLKANPYHAANGLFTSKRNAGKAFSPGKGDAKASVKLHTTGSRVVNVSHNGQHIGTIAKMGLGKGEYQMSHSPSGKKEMFETQTGAKAGIQSTHEQYLAGMGS